MRNFGLRHTCALGAIAISTMFAAPAFAQDAGADDEAEAASQETIVVTGTFIRGTPEDAALPVDVFSAETLAQSGVSSPLEFIKDLPSSGAVLGDSNQFAVASQGFQGNGSINLRGLGPTRTLVLFNGRRTIAAPGDGFTDTNLVPFFAVDRIELLKDGAAATYGSDAIAGVANFVTKKNFQGVEVAGDYEFIDGSDGNWTSSILVGKTFGAVNILAGFGWQHRSELGTAERDFTLTSFAENPTGWSSVGNPGTYTVRLGPITQGRAGTTIGIGLDGSAVNACQSLYGVPGNIGFPICRFTYVPFDNLIEEEDRYQGYLQAEVDLTDTLVFHAEAQYSKTDLESLAYSPSFPATQGPFGSGSANQFLVPSTNPGYRGFITQSGLAGGIADPFTPGTLANVNGSYAVAVLTRPLASGGNPRDEKGAGRGSAKNEAMRFSAGFEKEFSDTFRGQLYGTWWRSERAAFAPDVISSRLQNALEGFGGPGCNRATGTAGVGPCQYFNPFINSAPGHPVFNLTNPGYIPGNENDPDLVAWLQVPNGTFQVEEQTVLDLIFSGETGIDLGGGPIAYAFGAQYRENDFSSRSLNREADLRFNPCFREGDLSCVGTPIEGVGPFIFLGGTRPSNVGQDVKALFAEVNVPIGSMLEVTGAVRFEDYGGSVGSTINPKGAFRFEPTDWLVVRGSIGTTFAGPLAVQVSPNAVTSLAGIQAAANNFKSVDIFGNPTDLGPETALTWNIGAVVDFGGLTLSADYWTYDLEDGITTTPAQAIASNVVPTSGGLANCSNVFADLITFQGGTCVQGVTTGLDISRVRTDWVNGPGVKVAGLDLSADYTMEIGPGTASVGAQATHVMKYDVEDFVLRGVVVQPGFSADGFTNYFRGVQTISKWRVNSYVNYNVSGLNLRYEFRFVDGVTDDRCLVANACNATTFAPEVKSYTQHDFHVTYDLPVEFMEAQLQFSVENFTDEDPSAARLEVSYDPFIGNPFGRVYRVGLRTRF